MAPELAFGGIGKLLLHGLLKPEFVFGANGEF